MPIFDALRPEGPRDEGFVHAGAVGAGHYAKMVHNGIEYGLMQAYAEGYELLRPPDIVTDVPGSSRPGSRHRGPLLAARPAGQGPRGGPATSRRSPATPPTPARAAGPSRRRSPTRCRMPVITAALFARFASRQDDSPAMKAVAALRNQFGGHAVQAAEVDIRPGARSAVSSRACTSASSR